MRKCIILIACALMLLIACDTSSDKEAVPTTEPVATVTPTVELTVTSTPTPTVEPTATSVPELIDSYTMGVITEHGYESEWMNLRFTTQENMRMLSREEHTELVNINANLMYGDNAESIIENADMHTSLEMMVMSTDGAGISVSVRKLSSFYFVLSEKAYLSMLITSLQNIYGETMLAEDPYTKELGGETYNGTSIRIEDYSTGEVTYLDYFVRKKENRMIVVEMFYADYNKKSVQDFFDSIGTYDSEPIVLVKPTATPVPTVPDTYVKGKITETGFESEWMNLRFTAQVGMQMSTQEELDALMRQDLNIGQGNDTGVVLNYESMTTVIEMIAKTTDGADVYVQVEKMSAEFSTITEEEYLSAVLMNLWDNIAEVVNEEDFYTIEFGGKNYLNIDVASEDNAGAVMYCNIMVRKEEGRMISIFLTYTDDSVESAQNLFDSFGSYDSAPVILVTPTEVPAVSENVFETGAWNGLVYENKWLGFKYTAPEGAGCSITNSENTIVVEARWPEVIPYVQILVEKMIYEGMTEEEYAVVLMAILEEMEFSLDENLYVVEIAGQEYINIVATIETMDMTLYQEYFMKEKDGYSVLLVIAYTDDMEFYLQDVLNAFTEY